MHRFRPLDLQILGIAALYYHIADHSLIRYRDDSFRYLSGSGDCKSSRVYHLCLYSLWVSQSTSHSGCDGNVEMRQPSVRVERQSRRVERAFGAGWKIHGTNSIQQSRSLASGNDTLYAKNVQIRLRIYIYI